MRRGDVVNGEVIFACKEGNSRSELDGIGTPPWQGRPGACKQVRKKEVNWNLLVGGEDLQCLLRVCKYFCRQSGNY